MSRAKRPRKRTLAIGGPVLALAAMGAAPAAQLGPPDAGAVAPAGAWTVAGGAASGSGASATRLFAGAPEVAWRARLGGEIEGEPLVWDERVLAVVRSAPSRAELVTLDLGTGKEPIPRRVVRSPLDPGPSLWGSVLAWRAGKGEVEVARWGRGRVLGLASLRPGAAVSPPLVFEGEILVASDAGLARYAPGRTDPDWELPGRFRGRPALRGSRVYAVQVDDSGGAWLTSADRSDGGDAVHVHVGACGPAEALAPDDVQVVALDTGVFVQVGDALVVDGGHALRWVGVPRPLPRSGDVLLLPWAQGFLSAPARTGTGWLAHLLDTGGDTVLALAGGVGDASVMALARDDHHAAWLTGAIPPSITGGAALVGGRAFELDSRRVRWERAGTTRRAVPAREAVLLVEGDALVALRPGRRAGAMLLLGGSDQSTFKGHAVLRDGRILEHASVRADTDGAAEVDGDTYAGGAVLYAEDLLGQPRLCWGTDGLVTGVARLAEAELAEGFAALADRARRTNDAALIDRLHREAVLRGAEGRLVDRAREGLDDLTRSPRAVVESQVARIAEEERALLRRPAELAWERCVRLPPGAPPRARLALLEHVLDADPRHADAAAEVLRLMPDAARPGGAHDARDWIAFLRAAEEVEVVTERAPDGTRASWREDLVAFRSPRLLVVTPLARPGAIAQCLSLGELVCDAVDALLGVAADERALESPLVLHLYPSRAEYLAAGGPAEFDAGLTWTSGHYDGAADLSRLYLPEGEEGLAEALRTFAHELTHHLLVRRLGFPDDALQPGYWIVEGLASAVEEFRFDTVARTWDEAAPRSARLDAVASAPAEAQLDWSRLFAMSHLGFLELPPGDPVEVPARWVLGSGRQMTARHLFYHQAAAATRYLLHAEEAAHRAGLLGYLRAFHAGDGGALDVGEVFGVDPAELGRRIREHAGAR